MDELLDAIQRMKDSGRRDGLPLLPLLPPHIGMIPATVKNNDDRGVTRASHTPLHHTHINTHTHTPIPIPTYVLYSVQ